MALGPSRFTRVGETPYPHEEEGIAFVRDLLPNSDPYHAWALFELPDPSTGRLLEIDMLVIGYGALYLVEIKSHPGRISGDSTDWWWQPPDANGRKVWVDPPFRLTNLKAKILKSRLRQHIRDDRLLPYVQALVFLSSADVIEDLRADGRMAVVTREEIRDALLKHRFPGASSSWQNRRINLPQVQAVARALDKLGIRARKGKLLVGDFELREHIDEGPGYQDRQAVHQANPKLRARARTYLVPEQTSVERRQQLRRAADRESQLLYDVREHKNILSWQGYVPDAPLGPTVLFDPFEGGQPLGAFLRGETVTFDERVDILSQMTRALAYCHRREVVHGGLSPEAVLVRRGADGRSPQGGVEVRLTNFQLGRSQEVEATTHWSALASSPGVLYQAPELFEGAARDGRADIYSLGAVAYYLFSERPPGETIIEIREKLQRDQGLDVRVVDPSVPRAIADGIDLATQVSLANRADDANEWLEIVLNELTEPGVDEPDEEPDPLEAKSTDLLGDLMVVRVLGQGATSKVLEVVRESDSKPLALKVSLDSDHDERLRAEAEALGRLRHPRIVQLLEVRTIAGRTCLLLGLAGSETLKRHLDQEGTVSLDFASRYGDDLLAALEHLEDPDVQVTHRDIKPANLGVGAAGKTAHHLTLFDFSLAHVPRAEVGVGTSAYRDPFLASRGVWDAAADRWSAAVTLHEMLTGVRPSYGAALDPEARLDLSAERFDAAVRDALVHFFEKALHRDVERRFASAKDMRHAWFRVFEAPEQPRAQPAAAAAPADAPSIQPVHPDEELTDEEIRAIGSDTPIMALPLSFRARNGLDRAGLLTAADLLTLPENRLSAVRGVGTKVAREILAFRERWSRLAELDTALERAPQAQPFDPEYAGDDVLVTTVGLDERLATALSDAGLRTLGAVARAPAAQVEAIARRASEGLGTRNKGLGTRNKELGTGNGEWGADALRELLGRETAQANLRGVPRSLEELVAELLPRKKKRTRYLRALFGLNEPFAGRVDVSAREVADHFSKTAANVYAAVGAYRELWAQHGALADLEERAGAILDGAGGAIPLPRAADALLAKLPHGVSSSAERASAELSRARAAALLRIVAEVQKEEVDGIRLVRLGRGSPWLADSNDHTQVLRRLGQAADALAERDVLASPGETQRQLESVSRGSPLEGAPAAQLAEWAAAASERAACSALMEIYPRGLAPERAIELSATLLQAAARSRTRTGDSGLTVEEVARKVSARYPDAAPLPARPKLDELLRKLPLEWDEATGRYRRPGDEQGTSLGTSYGIPTRPTVSRHPAGRRGRADLDVDVEVAELDRSLRIAIEQRAFRAIAVNPAYAFEAAATLEERLGVAAKPIDTLLLEAMRGVMADKGIDPAVVHRADREGPGGKTWSRLVQLTRLAERRLIEQLTAPAASEAAPAGATPAPGAAPPAPLLLTRPGLLARYGLTDLLAALVERASQDDAEAIFLLVPCHDYGGVPQINDRLPIPGILPVHALRLPRAFVKLETFEAA